MIKTDEIGNLDLADVREAGKKIHKATVDLICVLETFHNVSPLELRALSHTLSGYIDLSIGAAILRQMVKPKK